MSYDSYVEKYGKTFSIDCVASKIDGSPDKPGLKVILSKLINKEESAMYHDEEKKEKYLARLEDLGHPNALEIEAIHTSTGFNANDHYFIPSELWAAKNTPINQIVDWEHDRNQIIGCIKGSYCKDQDGNDMTAADIEIDAETSFDLYTSVVVWARYFPEYAIEILEKYEKGNLFVSMECTFDDFDFAVETDNETIVVARNEETDFLTDNLRIFGGTGYYKNYKVGIAFRGIKFVGVGFVENPANKRSEVIDIAASEDDLIEAIENTLTMNAFDDIIAKNKVESSKKCKKNKKEEKSADKIGVTMDAAANKEKEGDYRMDYEKLYQEAQAKIAELEASIASLQENEALKASAAKIEAFEAKVAELEASKAEIDNSVAEKDEKIVALEAEKEELASKLAEIETERKNAERKVAIAELDVEVEDEELFAMSEDAFSALVKFAPKKVVETKEDEASEEEAKEQSEEDVADDATEDLEAASDESEEEDVTVEASKKDVKASEDKGVRDAVASII